MTRTSNPSQAEADLAFMRALVDGSRGNIGLSGATAYTAAGLLYGGQCLFHLVELVLRIRWPEALTLTVAIGVNVGLVAAIAWAVRRDRRSGFTGSTANRALNAAFGGAGLAALAMILVFAVNAVRRDDFTIWLFFPSVVFALQGACWFVAYMLRRTGWTLAVALGWFAAAVALGLSIAHAAAYLAVAAAALFLLMALPGRAMIRHARG